jgi:hypothetical protein
MNFLETTYKLLTNYLQTAYELLTNYLQTSYELYQASYKFLMNLLQSFKGEVCLLKDI